MHLCARILIAVRDGVSGRLATQVLLVVDQACIQAAMILSYSLLIYDNGYPRTNTSHIMPAPP